MNGTPLPLYEIMMNDMLKGSYDKKRPLPGAKNLPVLVSPYSLFQAESDLSGMNIAIRLRTLQLAPAI